MYTLGISPCEDAHIRIWEPDTLNACHAWLLSLFLRTIVGVLFAGLCSLPVSEKLWLHIMVDQSKTL